MTTHSKTYDVFISHSAGDAPLAAELARDFRASGLEAMTGMEISPGGEVSKTLWEALAESWALVVILSPLGPTPSMGIEIGAARAWNKPMFVLVTEPSSTRLPPYMAGIKVYPATRIEDVVDAIKVSGQQLSEEDRSLLATLFGEIGASVDQLALEPKQLQELVTRFTARSGKAVSGERLLSELLRLRKRGLLRRHRP